MALYGIDQHIGEYIRQSRRQHNLTQTELGGVRFSKSYVSAVERDKISPSTNALQYFAEQLGQSPDYFSVLLKQTESMKQLAVLSNLAPQNVGETALREEELTLLDILLESSEQYNLQALNELPLLSPEVISTLPPLKQARYYFLRGLIAQNKQNFSVALHAFEYALALAPDKHQPAILDEIGINYFLRHSYHTALTYHLRALNLLQNASISGSTTSMQFKVELHCGDDYLALGAYKQACLHYEHARSYLNSQHDMKTAGLLYLDLGYCTFALIRHSTALVIPTEERASPEEMERQFSRAVGFLVQSRSVYQVSGDRIGETTARLMLAMTELNFSTRRRQLAQDKAGKTGKQFVANCSSLLDDAEEQCRQVLLAWQDPLQDAGTPPAELDAIIFAALSYLIHVFIQRGALARLGEYTETSFRERALAAHLCQQVLDALFADSFPWSLIPNTLSLQMDNLAYLSPPLPRLPELLEDVNRVAHSPVSQVEVYFAAGELAEELGRVAKSEDYARECYTRANTFYEAVLKAAQLVVSMEARDPGYLVGYYQRCACILEERLQDAPELWEDTASTLLNVLKDGIYHLQNPILPPLQQEDAN